MPATIYDVARAVGVSASTVSRALSVPDMVSAATRERVRQAVADLGYRPNRAARGLITGRTGNIGLLVTDLTNPFFPGVVKGVQAGASAADLSVLLMESDEDPGAETGLVRALREQVDGIVLCAPRMSEADLRSVAADTPLVLLNRRARGVPSVTIDNLESSRLVTAHLRELGHRRVAYLVGPRTSWSNRERLRGLRIGASAAGLDLVELRSAAPTFGAGVDAGELVLASGVTAVIAYNDLIALGLLNRFRALGVAVPADVSVVGCDDIAFAGMVSPSLTTLAQPKESLGRAGVDLLLRVLDGTAPVRGTVTSRLIIRQSTGPCRPGA
ncbi:LacI family DNA-binding transcriptional regulator [Dactylosporangium sp. CA-152071]|uniref:LacI family DNA-binding transcriptional regulator n=1 Tax=Dactylosporangium sp. CA-152071 TaxID=3239933 RepID=UPI003D9322E0